MSSINLSEVLWVDNQDLVEAICEHPFIVGVRNGTLPSVYFERACAQDDYLETILNYHRRVVPLQTDISQTSWFSTYSSGGSLMRQKARVDRLARVQPTQETKKYLDFIITHADKCFAIVAASLFPCAMLYEHLAVRLSATRSSDKYKQWIDVYAPPRLSEYIIRLRYLIDHCEEADSSEVRSVCREGFEHELAFFSGVMQS